ncbi:MAG TPA: phospholipase D-like domain-containing protein [Candidatus Saccharimonadales bacterium]
MTDQIALKFYTKPEYFAWLAERARKATRGDRLIAATMSFAPHEMPVRKFLDAANAAAKRGADVQLIVDAYNLIFAEEVRMPGPLWIGREPNVKSLKPFREVVAEMERLRLSGGKYTMINRPAKRFSNFLGGRSHIKFALFNDEVLVGGCNLNHVSDLDVMIGFNDAKTAEALKSFAKDLSETPHVRNVLHDKGLKLAVDKSTTLFIDAGVPRQSAIYAQALEIIDGAKDWLVLSSTFLPHGRTMEKLLEARQRGVKVELLFSHPSHHPPIDAQLQYLVLLREKLRLPKEFLAGQLPKTMPKVHAKLVANETCAMLGSHNYVPTGTNFGTAEIALLRRGAAFARDVSLAVVNQTHRAEDPRLSFLRG